MDTTMTALKNDPAFGSFAAIGALCGVSREAVRKWDKVPAEFCRLIEEKTEGRFTRYELRPDVFGPPVAPADRAA